MTERLFDRGWWDTIDSDMQVEVEVWLRRIPYDHVLSVETLDDSCTSGNLVVALLQQDGKLVEIPVYDVHWDDPFPGCECGDGDDD
ncbi:MAG: hypothetical protein ACOYOQ_00300 [Microthrixaceae bacterium]